MKQCPECKTTYTDDTLSYCLTDGTTLVAVDREEETVVRHGVRVDIGREPEPPRTIVQTQPAAKSSGAIWKILAVILLLGFLGLIIVGAGGALYYYNSVNSNVAAASPTPKATPVPSPTVDAEKERLQKELANLQKQLETNVNSNTNKTPPWSGDNNMPTATVDSPNDGFLALRSEPDAEEGERIAQIPHGAVVELQNCEKEKVKIGSRTGRWCMVTYRGQEGWVFDAWLKYNQ